MEMQRFEVGDKVWDAVAHPGKQGLVESIGWPGGQYPILVRWEKRCSTAYTADGRYLSSFTPTLSHTPYEPTEVDNEPRKTKRERVAEVVRGSYICRGSNPREHTNLIIDEIFEILDYKE